MISQSRRRFLAGAGGLAASLVAGSWAISQDRPSRKITVYKNPT